MQKMLSTVEPNLAYPFPCGTDSAPIDLDLFHCGVVTRGFWRSISSTVESLIYSHTQELFINRSAGLQIGSGAR